MALDFEPIYITFDGRVYVIREHEPSMPADGYAEVATLGQLADLVSGSDPGRGPS